MRQIKSFILIAALSFSSCNYLDVIPPETADIDDTMKDTQTTLAFLYTCYGRIQYGAKNPIAFGNIDAAGDDYVLPQPWENASSLVQWGSITSYNSVDSWKRLYDGIGLCNQFMQLLDELNPPITPETKEQYKAEATFVKAYYHMRALMLFGPIPVMDTFMSQNTTAGEMPGRSHFDYCVDYIVGLFDQAAQKLPATWEPQFFGRGSSVIAKALKARLLLLAASPLYNSEQTPLAGWENKNFETPGYGKALVSAKYDPQKWERAREACQEALDAAEKAGFRLYSIADSETVREQRNVKLPTVAGIDGNTEEGQEFLKRVMMFRWMISSRQNEGNKENIWGVIVTENSLWGSYPHYVLTTDNGNKVGGWGGLSPTLYTVEHFFTENGKLPAEDEAFTQEADWFKSAGIAGNPDIINLHHHREARFYAWISFDGDEYSSNIVNNSPLIVRARDPQTQGYNPALWGNRNYSVTGYLAKKYVRPNFTVYKTDGGNNGGEMKYAAPMIRMAELYLSLAECQAQVGGQYNEGALSNLNIIRRRAGIPELTMAEVEKSGKSLLQHVLDERFVEFFQEGQRYYDIRRYLKGKERLEASCFEGLNAMVVGPTFEQFNTPTQIQQPFKWNERMYLLPVPSADLYSNPQMVQAPGY